MRRGGRRVAVKGNETDHITKTLYPESRDRHVQEAALRACLEGRAGRSARLLALPASGCGPVSFRPRLVTSILRCKGRCLALLSQRHGFSRGLNGRMLPHTGEFRPLRRSTRRCPPWTRTGLMSGDRKATRYWALGFEHGAALAETSPAPVRQRQGNRPALYPSGLQAPAIPPSHTVKARSAG